MAESCNPVFPEGTNADTHYRIRSTKCSEPCDCPVEERPAPRPRGRSYGTVSIQDGVYVYKDQTPSERERRGFVRYSEEYVPEIFPKTFIKSNKLSSFAVDLKYRDYKYVYRQSGRPLATTLSTDYDKQFNRVASSKNPIADVKLFISEYAGCSEAHKLRKRAIALSRIHNSISEEVFRFGIQDL